MNDLISRQAVIDAIEQHKTSVLVGHEWDEGIAYGYGAAHGHLVDIIKRLPSVDPVKHGKWIKHPGHVVHEEGAFQWKYDDIFECSLCGCKEKEASNYCPCCGTQMERGEE